MNHGGVINHREVVERYRAAKQRAMYHRGKFQAALDNLQALAVQSQKIPSLRTSSERLAQCDLHDLEQAVICFADAIRDNAREHPDKAQKMSCIADSAIADLRCLAHHVDHHADTVTLIDRLEGELHGKKRGSFPASKRGPRGAETPELEKFFAFQGDPPQADKDCIYRCFAAGRPEHDAHPDAHWRANDAGGD